MSGIETNYDHLAEMLNLSGAPLSVAELHGGLCGVMCVGGLDAGALWLKELLDDCVGDDGLLSDLAAQLEELGESTWRSLSGLSMEFTPLLPEADALVNVRADALGLWCHGFVAGLVVGGIDLSNSEEIMSPDLNELVQDFVQISRAGADSEEQDDDELADGALMELEEFVRVGAQFVFEELFGQAPGQRTIH